MDINLLTTVLSTFVNALHSGQRAVQGAGGAVLRGLAIIEIVLACLWIALDGTNLSRPFKKLLQLTFWLWFSTHFASIVKYFSDSLVQIGLSAGGQGGNIGLLLDPSKIAGMALDATQPLVQAMQDAGITHFGDTILLGLCFFALLACFFVIACHVCLAVIEYYLIVTLATCLIPFGISEHTKFIAEKAIGAAVAVSVKLMVLSFVIALIQPTMAQIHFSGGGEIRLNEALSMLLVSALLAFLVWRAPGFAGDLLAGSPSLSAAVVGQNITSAVSSGASMASGAIGGAVGATRAAASVASGGVAGGVAALRTLASAATAGARGKGATSAAASPPPDAIGGGPNANLNGSGGMSTRGTGRSDGNSPRSGGISA